MNENNSLVPASSRPDPEKLQHASDLQDKKARHDQRPPASESQRFLVLLAELFLATVSYFLSVVVLRDGRAWGPELWGPTLPIVVGFRFLGFYWAGLYKSNLRYGGLFDLTNIIKAVSFSSILIFLFVHFAVSKDFPPLALFVLDWALLQLLLCGLHFGARIYKSQRALGRRRGKRVVIVGAGDAGISVIHELASDPGSGCLPVAVIDDNPQTHGSTICGVPVAGSTADLVRIVRACAADEVLICVPSATQSEMSRIFAVCCQSNVPVRTLPTLAEIIDGKATPRDLRTVHIEDLLRRDELRPDPREISEIVGEKVVLITGAGGSIGSELSRQVAASGPRVLLLLEKTENSLFYIHRELSERFPSLQIKPLLLDTTLRDRIDGVFHRERPDLVFHAAAHKHVGLLELHPAEAIRNNVLGTRNVALAALHNGAGRFVNISTDKAVNPENYMGVSKKLTELCVQELSSWNLTRFMNVRFGNVAGSAGSVLGLFWNQIQEGKPVQVTDPRATRYFMSIPEAVYLILRAASQGAGGETFVLEMGEPINIYELAKSLSLLAGLAPGKEIPIHFVGLRDGEKVTEQLWESWEKPMPTSHNGILSISGRHPLASGVLDKIDSIETYLSSNDHKGLLDFLGGLFPEFAASRKAPSPLGEEEAKPLRSIPQELPMNIPLSKPDIGEREIQYVTEVLRTGKLSLGPRLCEFEEKFAAYVGTRFAVATNSGTSALHLCVRALGIGPQDEVITTPFSFVASTNCILYEGALPVFIDIDPVTMNIDPKQVRRFLRQCCGLDSRRGVLVDKTTGRVVKAILPVHVFGLPCDMDPIMELARQYGLAVIEDACEALGAEYRGRRVGTLGDAAAFAFYPNKQMTTAEGGMIVTDNEEIAALCRSMRNQGRDTGSSWLRHIHLGYNYRLSDLHCALGLAQLERIDDLLRARDRIASEYNQALAGSGFLLLPSAFEGIKRSWFVYVIQINIPAPRVVRDRLLLKLREQGIECQAYFPAIHKQPYLSAGTRSPFGPLLRAESASDRCLALPFFSSQSQEEIEFVTETLCRILSEDLTPAQPRVFATAAT
jgi:FlaA1/EpsC-like NDP-sugar epimerase/dTDP-4-amino-4,6-dideoxygalactose transaminase